MCYSDDARPPAPPVQGEVAEHGDLVLESADGTRFGAYFAHPASPTDRAIVIMPDIRGLHQFYKDLAQRWAEAGLHAVAIDYFGRTAGIGPRDEDFQFREHVDKMEFAAVDLDVAAATNWLRGHGAGPVFTVGFCLGGALSWRQSAAEHRPAGCIGFYGIPSRVTDRVSDLSSPLLILAAGQDFTPVPDVEKFADEVRARGVEVEMQVYPDAPHSFFDRAFGEHVGECADAWRRSLDFVNRHAAT